ncbi:hypothetical protein [Erythrobacter sp.]|uniref:hypothetical protein n=1 Tax=Erythrobacter sp. TaxID=1042 RepID=UPI0025E6E492|nr:hypothetical protein [Erythrobacter sp.]
MTQNGPISAFMSIVRKALAEDMSEVTCDVLAYDDLCRQAEEVDESGKLTKHAHRARSRLRHPFRLEESPEKTRKKVAKQERERKRKVMDLLSEAGRELAIWHEKRSELEELDRHEATLTPVGKSREDHDPESVFALGSPLLERLGKAGVAPSSFTRMPDPMITCIADLFKAHTKDPHLKDPDNPWRLMVNAGILEAPPRDLDEDQQRVVLHAYALRSEQQKEFAAKARRDLALPEGFSEHFLLGASRISDLARELSQGEYDAYYRCVGLRHDRDIELLGQVLGLDSEEDRVRLSVIVDLLSEASRAMMEDTSWTVALVSIKGFIDRIQPHKRYRKDWVNELIEGLPALADELSEAAGSIEVFDRFLMHGLGLSEAKRGFDERKEKRKQAKREADFWADIANACEHNWTFKIEDSTVIYEGVEWYSDLDAEEWTGSRWIEVHGLPPELEKYYSSLNSDEDVPTEIEDIEVAKDRLTELVRSLREECRGSNDEVKKVAYQQADRLAIMGGGLDKNDRPVFVSIEDFDEGLEYAKGQQIL